VKQAGEKQMLDSKQGETVQRAKEAEGRSREALLKPLLISGPASVPSKAASEGTEEAW
jgi:hypothetical protein